MRIDANGISIHYSIEGPDDGPVVVLSHSLAANLAMWDWQMPVLEDFRVVRYDTRGHGGTDAPAGEYTLEMLADDLFGFLDALNLDTVHYVGLSMGGMIGQTAALKDQSRFLSLGLCDTSSVVPLAGKEAWTERIAVARAEGMEAVMPSTIERWFSPEYQKNESGEVDKIREMIRSRPVDGFCGCCHAIMGPHDRMTTTAKPVYRSRPDHFPNFINLTTFIFLILRRKPSLNSRRHDRLHSFSSCYSDPFSPGFLTCQRNHA